MYLCGVKFKFNFNIIIKLLLTIIMCKINLINCLINDFGESCDWTGSGLETEHEKHEVKPIYLRCTQGTIKWKYPNGALRIVLRKGTSGKDFHGCLRIWEQSSDNIRIYLEGHRKLNEFYSPDDSESKSKLRCFNSYNGQISFYVQNINSLSSSSSSSSSLSSEHNIDNNQIIYDNKNVAIISYDLEFSQNDGEDECRPCTHDELIKSYCSSDIVFLGNMNHIVDKHKLDFTEINVKLKKILRQSIEEELPTLEQYNNNNNFESLLIENSNSNSNNKNTLLPIEENNKNIINKTNIYISNKCGVKLGYDDFLFMINRKLGYNLIKCAPRYEEWKDLVKNNSIYKHCVLKI